MAKYKVGDKIKVRKDLIVDTHYYGVYRFTTSMSKIAKRFNYVLTIGSVVLDEFYRVEEMGDLPFIWTNEMFEGLAEDNSEIEKFEAFLREVADGTGDDYCPEWESLKILCNAQNLYDEDISREKADGLILKLVDFYKTFKPKKKKKMTMAELRELVGEDFEIVD